MNINQEAAIKKLTSLRKNSPAKEGGPNPKTPGLSETKTDCYYLCLFVV